MDSPPPIGPISGAVLALLVFVSFTVARPTLKLQPDKPSQDKTPAQDKRSSPDVSYAWTRAHTEKCHHILDGLNRMELMDLTRNHALNALEALQVCLNAVKVELDGERSGNINTLGESCDEAHSAFLNYSREVSTLLMITRGILPDGETDEASDEEIPALIYE
ncbi:hypothetical protein B0H14DRAFT_3531454 [Mycena olivaceomarginata]|nr:hypothetical protein B0H14DRAFT_3531454 [Mycena olivaceomarginata]